MELRAARHHHPQRKAHAAWQEAVDALFDNGRPWAVVINGAKQAPR